MAAMFCNIVIVGHMSLLLAILTMRKEFSISMHACGLFLELFALYGLCSGCQSPAIKISYELIIKYKH